MCLEVVINALDPERNFRMMLAKRFKLKISVKMFKYPFIKNKKSPRRRLHNN